MAESNVKAVTLRDGRQVTIRPPQSGDAEGLLAWFLAIVAEDTFIGATPETVVTLEQEERFVAAMLEKIRRGDALNFYAATDDDDIVGHIGVDRIKGRSAHCGALAIVVAKEWRNCGLGTELMGALLDEVGQLGLHAIFLSVMATNAPAIHLYSKIGFRQCGRLPQYIEHRGELVDRVDMWLPLAGPAPTRS